MTKLGNQRSFARDVIASMEYGRQGIPTYIMINLLKKYGINLNWLIAGEGSMLIDESKREKEIKELERKLDKLKGI